jgi:hypothetical protein
MQSSADFITNTSGFSFRYTQIDHIGDSFELALISGSPTPVLLVAGFAVFGEGRTTRGARLRRKSMSMM